MKKIIFILPILVFVSSCGKSDKSPSGGRFVFHLDTTYKQNSLDLEIEDIERTFYFNGSDGFSYCSMSKSLKDSSLIRFNMGRFKSKITKEYDRVDSLIGPKKDWVNTESTILMNDSQVFDFFKKIDFCLSNQDKEVNFRGWVTNSRVSISPGGSINQKYKGQSIVNIGSDFSFFSKEELENMKACYLKYKKESK